jgi:hypothetical protein
MGCSWAHNIPTTGHWAHERSLMLAGSGAGQRVARDRQRGAVGATSEPLNGTLAQSGWITLAPLRKFMMRFATSSVAGSVRSTSRSSRSASSKTLDSTLISSGPKDCWFRSCCSGTDPCSQRTYLRLGTRLVQSRLHTFPCPAADTTPGRITALGSHRTP